MPKEQINIRVTEDRKERWERAADSYGYDSVSQLIRQSVDAMISQSGKYLPHEMDSSKLVSNKQLQKHIMDLDAAIAEAQTIGRENTELLMDLSETDE